MFARTPEYGNCALLLERVELGRRPHLPCPSRWICAPRRVMATTSQNEAARELVFTLRPSDVPVKSEDGKAVAGWRESEQGETIPFPVLEGDDSLV
jgi:hypothetical protein